MQQLDPVSWSPTHPSRPTPREVLFPDGTRRWQCPNCGGYYVTQAQAALTIKDYRAEHEYHRCHARPQPGSWKECCSTFRGVDGQLHVCDKHRDPETRQHSEPGPHYCKVHHVSEEAR